VVRHWSRLVKRNDSSFARPDKLDCAMEKKVGLASQKRFEKLVLNETFV
jgi:hypothetical protein